MPYIVIVAIHGIHVRHTMYIVHCTLYNIQCTMYNEQCTMRKVHENPLRKGGFGTMYVVHCMLYNIR